MPLRAVGLQLGGRGGRGGKEGQREGRRNGGELSKAKGETIGLGT